MYLSSTTTEDLKNVDKSGQNVRVKDDGTDDIIIVIKLELSVFTTYNHLCVMNDENTHTAYDGEANNHV